MKTGCESYGTVSRSQNSGEREEKFPTDTKCSVLKLPELFKLDVKQDVSLGLYHFNVKTC